MIVQPNNFGQPWFVLFTRGPNPPEKPNKGHIHVTSGTYEYGEVVYSPSEPSDHTKLWCKTLAGNDYAILGQSWRNSPTVQDFSRIEFACDGVFQWSGEQWSRVEASIWTGSEWSALVEKDSLSLLLGVYGCTGGPKPLTGINAALVYARTEHPVNTAAFVGNRYSNDKSAYGFRTIYDSTVVATRLASPIPVTLVGNGKGYIIKGGDQTACEDGYSYYRWNGKSYIGAMASTTEPELVFQFSVSGKKPTKLTTPGYWFKQPNASAFYLARGTGVTVPEGGILAVYSSAYLLPKVDPLLLDSSLVKINNCYFIENGKQVLKTAGSDWDMWDGAAWKLG